MKQSNDGRGACAPQDGTDRVGSAPAWYCVRQRAGPLVKEQRSIRPRRSNRDSPFDRVEKNKILRPPSGVGINHTRTDRLELRLALFGHEGSFYTLTFRDGDLPASWAECERVWRAFLKRMQRLISKPFDYAYCIEGRHGDHRYHMHLVTRDSDFPPAAVQHTWGNGWVDDEPLLRGPGDSYRRTARYMTKEATDGLVIPINKHVCRWSRSLDRQLPAAERFAVKSGSIRTPKDVYSRGNYSTENRWGTYRYAWYIKQPREAPPPWNEDSQRDDWS